MGRLCGSASTSTGVVIPPVSSSSVTEVLLRLLSATCAIVIALLVLALALDCHVGATAASSQAINHAYIGPGAGFAFLGSFLTILLSLLASLLSILMWPFRMLYLAVTRQGRFSKARVKKVIILGLDGLDPKLMDFEFRHGAPMDMRLRFV